MANEQEKQHWLEAVEKDPADFISKLLWGGGTLEALFGNETGKLAEKALSKWGEAAPSKALDMFQANYEEIFSKYPETEYAIRDLLNSSLSEKIEPDTIITAHEIVRRYTGEQLIDRALETSEGAAQAIMTEDFTFSSDRQRQVFYDHLRKAANEKPNLFLNALQETPSFEEDNRSLLQELIPIAAQKASTQMLMYSWQLIQRNGGQGALNKAMATPDGAMDALWQNIAISGPSEKLALETGLRLAIGKFPNDLLNLNHHKSIAQNPTLKRDLISGASKNAKPSTIIQNASVVRQFAGEEQVNKALSDPEGAIHALQLYSYDERFKPSSDAEREAWHQGLREASRSKADHIIREKYNKFFDANPALARELIHEAAQHGVEDDIVYNWKSVARHAGMDLVTQILNTRTGALTAMRRINELHESPDSVRFEILQAADARAMYNMITLGRAEIYTSSYNGLIDVMESRLETENKTLPSLLSPEEMQRLPTFLEAAASFGRLEDVLRHIPPQTLNDTISHMINEVVSVQNTSQVIALSDLMRYANNPELKVLLEQQLKTQYERTTNAQSRDLLGLIASDYAASTEIISPDTKEFFSTLAAKPRYQLPNYDSISATELVDSRGVNVQRHYFYDDVDGRNTYAMWLKQYRDKSGWTIEEHPEYVVVRGQGSPPVEMYVNTPEAEYKGAEVINTAVAQAQGTTTPYFPVVVHRGHSYHVHDTIKKLDTRTQLVYLGSCGGYQALTDVMTQSPAAQVVSTKGKGTFAVNNPMLMEINQTILEGNGINWPDLEKKMLGINSDWAELYVTPNKNHALAMIRQWNKLQENSDSTGPAQQYAKPRSMLDGMLDTACYFGQNLGLPLKCDTPVPESAPTTPPSQPRPSPRGTEIR